MRSIKIIIMDDENGTCTISVHSPEEAGSGTPNERHLCAMIKEFIVRSVDSGMFFSGPHQSMTIDDKKSDLSRNILKRLEGNQSE